MPPAPGLRRNLPNALTVLRLLLAAGFFGTLNVYRYPDIGVAWANVAIAMFILGAITDFADGYLARRWHVESTFGRIMDPLCDKVLIIGAFIYLAGPRFIVSQWIEADSFFTQATGVYPWMVVVILTRELLVTSIRGAVEAMGHSFAAAWSGKAKMILQCICIPLVLFLVVNFRTGEPGHEWALYTCYALIYATVVITVWSGLPYFLRAHQALKGAAAERARS